MAITTGKNTTEVLRGAPETSGGYCFKLPMGTVFPTDASTPPDPAAIDQGYLSEEGVEVKTDAGTDKIRDWDKAPIALIQKSNDCSITLEFVQVSAAVARTMFGDANVEVDATTGKVKAIHYTGDLLSHFGWLFRMRDANGPYVLAAFDGMVTGMSGFKLAKDEVVSFKAEIELFKNPANNRFFSILR